MPDIEELTNHLGQPPYVYLAVVALILLVLLYVLYRYRRAHQGIIPFKAQGGTIEIAPQTLRAIMENAVDNVEGVERATCRHVIRGHRLGVKIALHIKANQRLRDIDTRVKERLRATLQEQFGIESVEPIHIRVTRIIGDPVASLPKNDTLSEGTSRGEPLPLPETGKDASSSDARP